MSRVAVAVEHLGKRYALGRAIAPDRMVRGTMSAAVRSALGRFPLAARRDVAAEDEFWALDDVSFEVGHGEVLGVIGRNGAGKSTLLKILARITEPTTGRAVVHGRVGSLLEVGTGFHPELTGRENVFLNGAILGMSRADIVRRFDEIVAFAELERFLDTPVKRYSSGMYMRLAFSVAAHLEPEVLIVDEVLAVGDAEFQKKCLGKMGDVAGEGRTVLFVSHNMPAVARLCRRALMLSRGRIVQDGAASSVVSAYLSSNMGTSALREWDNAATAPGDEIVRLRRVRVRDADGRTTEEIDVRRPVGIDLECDVLASGAVLTPSVHLFDADGVCAFVSANVAPEWRDRPRPPGRHRTTVWIPGNLLAEGSLIAQVSIATLDPLRAHVHVRDAASFNVVDSDEGDTARGDFGGQFPGVLRPLLRWTTEFEPGNLPTASPAAGSSAPTGARG